MNNLRIVSFKVFENIFFQILMVNISKVTRNVSCDYGIICENTLISGING